MILHREEKEPLTDCLILPPTPPHTQHTCNSDTMLSTCIVCLTGRGIADEATACEILPQRNFWLEPHPVSFFFSILVKKETT